MNMTSLRTLITAAISAVSLLLTFAVSYAIGQDAVTRLEQQIGKSLALLADEAQDKLDRAMFERLQALQNLASVGELSQKIASPEALNNSLVSFQSTYSDFAWIGLADARGNIAGATGGTLEGQNVANQPWFQFGSQRPFVGKVRVEPPGSNSATPLASKDTRFIDLSVPVLAMRDKSEIVLGASLSPA